MADVGALGDLLRGADAFVQVASIAFGHADGQVTAFKTAEIQRSVFSSSTALFTRLPAASKAARLAAEDRLRMLQGAWTILRPTIIYGDR
jgi:uncharacterized protein YbjT (DUF2867 family)